MNINKLQGFQIQTLGQQWYVVFKILIVKEDKYLDDKFGEEFLKYKKRGGEIFPNFLNIFRTN